MEIRVYFCAVLYNEDTEIIQIVDAKREATDTKSPDALSQVQDSKTSLKALYAEGWRLIQVVPSSETKGYRFFMERT